MYCLVGIGVRQTFKNLTHRDPNAEFFVQLPLQALLEGLTLFDFSAGKLPESTQMGIVATPGYQHVIVAKHEPGCDLDYSNACPGRRRIRSADFSASWPATSFWAHRPMLL